MAQAAVSVPTSTTFVNRALVLLGDAPVSSLTDGSAQAAIVSTFYDSAFEEFIGSTGWRWAMRTAVPARHSLGGNYVVPADPQYLFQYTLPSDFLTLYRVEQTCTHEIALVPGDLTANTTNLIRAIWSTVALDRIHYVAKVGEECLPPHAQEAFVYKLAHILAIPVQSNRARSEYFYGLYMKSLRRAQAIDARQRPTASIVENGRLAIEWDQI